MNDLENNVPPFKLCKNIPSGEFADTALVWMYRPALEGISDDPFMVDCRIKAEYLKRESYSAPILSEIMKKLPFGTIVFMDAPETFAAISYGGTSQAKVIKDTTPEIAALRLWFKIKNIEMRK